MSYIRQRMEDKSRTDIELTPLKAEIEAVFNKRNIDEDCDTIANLLSPYQKAVRESISQGKYAEVVAILTEVLESLTYHFVEDEHYNYFDDMYSPDYVCQDMMEAIINSVKSGNYHQFCQKRKFSGRRVATVERRNEEVEAYGGIRGLWCAVCAEYMGKV